MGLEFKPVAQLERGDIEVSITPWLVSLAGNKNLKRCPLGKFAGKPIRSWMGRHKGGSYQDRVLDDSVRRPGAWPRLEQPG